MTVHVFRMFSLRQQKFFQDVKVVNIENLKVLAPLLLNHYHFRVAHVCYFLDELLVNLIFATMQYDVGPYKLKLYHFYCNAQMRNKMLGCRYIVKLITLHPKTSKTSFIFHLLIFESKLQNTAWFSKFFGWNLKDITAADKI